MITNLIKYVNYSVSKCQGVGGVGGLEAGNVTIHNEKPTDTNRQHEEKLGENVTRNLKIIKQLNFQPVSKVTA